MRTLSIVLFSCVLAAPCSWAATLGGTVVDGDGKPAPQARVFVEPGLAGEILETKADEMGRWRVEGVPAGGAGVFGIAPGQAFGGVHVQLAVEAVVDDVQVRLGRTAEVKGKVVDPKGEPVAGARITRMALLGEDKVGIPLAKLREQGFEEPVSGEDGRFSLGGVPAGTPLALKVAHPSYAQEGATGITAGDSDVRVALYPGVLVEGDVRMRGSDAAVTDAAIIIRNAQPPHDTAVTKTNGLGRFAVRLKPGRYMYQAASTVYHSPGWQPLNIMGSEPLPRVRLLVAGIGQLRGKVCDAASGEPIADARVVLSTLGNLADVTRTGPTGEFVFTAMEGENTVRLEGAPGYLLPDQAALRVRVSGQGENRVPTFWLAPIPTYAVRVVDEGGAPVAQAALSMLRPEQLGWHVTDDEGRATLGFATLRQDEPIIGFAEHLSKPWGALFAIDARSKEEAVVQLAPLSTVEGRVTTDGGKPIEGAAVAAVYGEDGVPLWRTVSARGGSFRWESAVPGVAQRCVACGAEGAAGKSMGFSVEPGAAKNVGNVVVPDGEGASSLLGKALAWYENAPVSGAAPERKEARNTPAVVVYCLPDEVAMVAEAFETAGKLLGEPRVALVAVVQGPCSVPADCGALVLRGENPGRATTYVVGSDNKVLLETFGLPPLRVLLSLSDGA